MSLAERGGYAGQGRKRDAEYITEVITHMKALLALNVYLFSQRNDRTAIDQSFQMTTHAREREGNETISRCCRTTAIRSRIVR